MSEREGSAWASPAAVVRALPFMAQLPPEVRNLVLAGFEERTYHFGETVSAREDSAFVVVVAGEVRVVAEGADGTEVSLGVLGPGQTSGERALVEETPPGVTLRAASSAVRVLRLDRGVAVALARAHPEAAAAFSEQAHAKRIAAFLRTDETFRDLDAKGVELIVGRGRAVDARDGDVVVREGERTASWWIVESGRLVETTGRDAARRDVRFLRAGDVFGEVGALASSARLTSVTAVGACRLLELDAAVLGELGTVDPAFASKLADRAKLHLSRIAVRPLDFGGDDALSGVRQRPPVPPPSPDQRIAAGVEVSAEPQAVEPWVAPRRFPFVRQIDFADCGVASLAMVCRAFGRKVSLPFLRHVAGTGQDGTSLRGIMLAADEAGLEGHAFKASRDRLDGLQLPAIIHWEGNHWIVLYAVEGDRVRVADPGRGLRRLSRAEVEEKWSGWCATFRPTPRLDDAPVEHLDLTWVRPLVRPFAIQARARDADGDRGDGARAARAGPDAARGRCGGRRRLAPRVAARRLIVALLLLGLESACCSGGCSHGRRCDSTGRRSTSSPGAFSSSRSSTSRRAGRLTSSAGSTDSARCGRSSCRASWADSPPSCNSS